MSKERLEQIKDAIAHELGLTDDYMDGTYLYHLTRSKSAFAVGTMTLDDFKEIDEELLDEIFNAIEPFFIEQAERVQELEKENRLLRFIAEENKIAYEQRAKQNKRYREALEFYAEGKHVAYKLDETDDDLVVDYGEIARKALEGEE